MVIINKNIETVDWEIPLYEEEIIDNFYFIKIFFKEFLNVCFLKIKKP